MKNKYKIIALALSLMMLLSGCGSDYPVVDRKLDITELIQAIFEGTGKNIEIENGEVTVNCVADRMKIDMDESADTISDIREAVKNATVADDGLTGAWKTSLDISPVICEIFYDVEGLNLAEFLDGTYIPATLTFTNDGNYTLKFDKKSLDKAYDDILDKAAKATKDYMQNGVTGVGKIAAQAIPQSTVENILVYVVRAADEILENGASGTYVVKNGKIIFDGSDSCGYLLSPDNSLLSISGASATGVLSSLTAVDTITFTKV